MVGLPGNGQECEARVVIYRVGARLIFGQIANTVAVIIGGGIRSRQAVKVLDLQPIWQAIVVQVIVGQVESNHIKSFAFKVVMMQQKNARQPLPIMGR